MQQELCALQHAPPVQQSNGLEVAPVEPTSESAAMIAKRYFISSPVEVSFLLLRQEQADAAGCALSAAAAQEVALVYSRA